MIRPLSATLLAAVLAFSPMGAGVAHADRTSDIAAAAIIGGLLIYGISEAEKKKRKTQQSQQTTRHATYPSHAAPGQRKKWNKRVLPVQCLRTVESRSSSYRRGRQVVGTRCLREFGVRADLPRACATRFPTHNGTRQGYSANCLLDRGYVLGNVRR